MIAKRAFAPFYTIAPKVAKTCQTDLNLRISDYVKSTSFNEVMSSVKATIKIGINITNDIKVMSLFE